MGRSEGTGMGEAYEQAREVLKRHEADLLQRANVLGVGVGQDEQGEPILVVMVREKVPRDLLPAHSLVPPELDGVAVDVREIGDVSAHGDTDSHGSEEG